MYSYWKKEMVERADELIVLMREQCLGRGCGGIKELSVVFRHMDADFSKRLSFEELEEGLKNYGIEISKEDLSLLFLWFDKDDNKTVDFCEFIHRLRPPMSEIRKQVVLQAFDKMDVNGDGELKTDDLKGISTSFFIILTYMHSYLKKSSLV